MPPLPDTIDISPSGPVRGTVRPPGSKSITNRALVCAALADGHSTLTGALDSDDTQVMVDALRRLGVHVEWSKQTATIELGGGWVARSNSLPASGGRQPPDESPQLPDESPQSLPTRPAPPDLYGWVARSEQGGDGRGNSPLDLYVGNSGTTVRFLTAMLTVGHGHFRLDGNPRMRERPIQDLLDALGPLGADATCELGTGCPPVIVRADGLSGGETTVRGDISSQYLSALLMAVPYARQGVRLKIDGPLVSQPYVRMTLAVMRAFGVEVAENAGGGLPLPPGEGRGEGEAPRNLAFDIGPAKYTGRAYAIEPDASAASYFFAAAGITDGSITVAGLSRASLQGDVAFVDLLQQMGCRVEHGPQSITVHGGPLRGIEADMNAISDTVQTLAAVALFAAGPTTITGVAHIRHKETDRIGNLAAELRKFGAIVDELPDGLRIAPPRAALQSATIATYDDHRMAMSLSLPGLRVPGVVIQQPGCVAKTYPRFFDDLAAICYAP